jgi:hypothetical protein
MLKPFAPETYRPLTQEEKNALDANRNRSCGRGWNNVFVSAEAFDPNLVCDSEFAGVVYIGRLYPRKIRYHDLELADGIYHSYIEDCVLGDSVCVRNTAYLKNYRIGSRVMLFNVQEMSCTGHAKFGNGILKEGEDESLRVWIGAGNENEGRAVLPFEGMLPADAWLWSRHRDNKPLLERLVAFTEQGNDGKRDTFGAVGDGAVVKNTLLVKDAKIGAKAYIKGALKLKNVTVCSSEAEPSQVGEGVVLVNGIMGYGSKVFYQAAAVRFVIGRNCQLKYGARLLNSVLGDNSTVSCCELLNNLIYPFHEQHHNTSFLIAATVMGQSNIAAGATVGSNHNSRSNDGEIVARRGFWTGLCASFKHNSSFASFTLAAKGAYRHELNISYPFSLISPADDGQALVVIPAYWFTYNMFAVVRNRDKFAKRDRRAVKAQHIETDPLAPDTVQEILSALSRLIELTAQKTGQTLGDAKEYLHRNPDADLTLDDPLCQRKGGAKVLKATQSYQAYRKAVVYFAVKTLLEYSRAETAALPESRQTASAAVEERCAEFAAAPFVGSVRPQQCADSPPADIPRRGLLQAAALRRAKSRGAPPLAEQAPASVQSPLSPALFKEISRLPLYTDWENAGGQVLPSAKAGELVAGVVSGAIRSWDEAHAFYDRCQAEYPRYKARYALFLLEQLYSCPFAEFTPETFAGIRNDVRGVSDYIYESALRSREKDFSDPFRAITYRNEAEMDAVLGTLSGSEFLQRLERDTRAFKQALDEAFSGLV